MEKIISIHDVKANPAFKALISAANNNLKIMGYTEHGERHVGYVSHTTYNILEILGYDARTCEVGEIAGWIHDIGNAVNRKNHGPIGATIALGILMDMKMDAKEIATIAGAIGNHEEETGTPVGPVSAALIIADKSDAHRSRVRNRNIDPSDIHDRVNLAITKNLIAIDVNKRLIKLKITMEDISSTMDYLTIYLSRITLCEKAAQGLDCSFELEINGTIINRKNLPPDSIKLGKGEREVSEEG